MPWRSVGRERGDERGQRPGRGARCGADIPCPALTEHVRGTTRASRATAARARARPSEQRGDGAVATEPTAASGPLFERPPRPLPGPRRLRDDLGPIYAANGLIGLIFAATGPVAVILAVGRQGGLSQADIAYWVFGVFFLNGILTVLACWLYRQPLAFFWTIPGTVLVGPALGHLGWPQVVGAFFATGILMLVLGVTGWVRRVMVLIPMPIVMGMVAGVFLRFGTDLVRALGADVV